MATNGAESSATPQPSEDPMRISPYLVFYTVVAALLVVLLLIDQWNDRRIADRIKRARSTPNTIPPIFAIGSPVWPGLSKLTEESGEVQQVIGKLMGTGGAIQHWDGSNLQERLIEEMGDCWAALQFVASKNNLDMGAIERRRAKKLALFNQWHEDVQTKGFS